MILLIDDLFSIGLKRTAHVALLGSVTAWTATALLAAAFPCKLPQLWAILGDKCFKQVLFWTFTVAVDILFDITVILVPFIYVRRLQAPFRFKATVWGCFAARILYVEENSFVYKGKKNSTANNALIVILPASYGY